MRHERGCAASRPAVPRVFYRKQGRCLETHHDLRRKLRSWIGDQGTKCQDPEWAWRMAATRVGRGRLEPSLVRLSSPNGLCHCIIDFENGALSAIVAVELLFVLPFHDGERIH